MNSTDPNARQVGGNHYARGGKFQHWDFTIEYLDNRYLEGALIKYVWRHRFKGIGEMDLEKASHFADKLIDAAKRGTVRPMRWHGAVGPLAQMWTQRFLEILDANELNEIERDITRIILNWRGVDDLVMVKDGIATLLESLHREERRREAVKAGRLSAFEDSGVAGVDEPGPPG